MPSDQEHESPPPASTVAKLTPDTAAADPGSTTGTEAAADVRAPGVDSSAPRSGSAPGGGGQASPDQPGGTREPSVWPERLSAAGASTWRWIGQPRVRLATVGVLLLLIGGLVLTNSVWTLPLVVIGALMVVVAWMGRRLEGRVAVEWGESGTEVLVRATIKAPVHDAQLPAPARAGEPARIADPAARTSIEPEGSRRREDVIEGEAHTVEIDVADLRALIAAVETAEAEAAEADAAAAGAGAAAAETPPSPREFRLHRTARETRAAEPR